MNARININVSAVDYEKTSKQIISTLSLVEEMVHGKNEFVLTDSEFAFGWHFFVVSVNVEMIHKLAEQMGTDFDKYIYSQDTFILKSDVEKFNKERAQFLSDTIRFSPEFPSISIGSTLLFGFFKQ